MHRFFRRAIPLAVLGLALGAGPVHGQDGRRVEGRVVEPQGQPVQGVSVQVGGTALTVETDTDGRFVLTGVPAGAQRLRFERLGFTPAARVLPAGSDPHALRVVLTPRPIEMEGLTVIGSPADLAEVRVRMRHVPGAVDLIESAEIEASRQANLTDVLQLTPGVWIQPRFGAADESQLSIRGSGLRSNFHLRGVNILVNGMPYRNADGFTDFESLELLTAANIQLYKGGNAFRFGGSTLGGAINLVTKTGYTAEPFQAYTQGGSYGFIKGQVSSGDVIGDTDYYASYAYTALDGYRAFSNQRRDRINAHLGALLSPGLDLRAFYFFAHVEEKLPGSLTREQMATDPRQANPNNVENRWGREYDLHHLGLQVRAQPAVNQRLDVSPYLQLRDIVHPIFRILDQTSRDIGAEVRYENTDPIGRMESRFTAGFQPAFGVTDNRQFENVSGERGELAKDQEEEAWSLAFYAEEALSVTPRFTAIAGLRHDRSRRTVSDDFLADGDQTDERDYAAWLPRVGFLYDLPSVGGQVFANATRSHEPPLLLELNSLAVPGFIDLESQQAWQFELGTRAEAGAWRWEAAVYDIEIENEILNQNVQPFPEAPFTVPAYRNAPETRHYGLEAGLEYAGAGPVGARLAYTLARYEYVSDPQFEGNDIPGAPEHVLQAEISFTHPSGLTLRPAIEWVPAAYFVDSANRAANEGWLAADLRAEWSKSRWGAMAFVEIRNLTGERYSPAVTVDDAAGRFFLPADGRSVYAGLRWRP